MWGRCPGRVPVPRRDQRAEAPVGLIARQRDAGPAPDTKEGRSRRTAPGIFVAAEAATRHREGGCDAGWNQVFPAGPWLPDPPRRTNSPLCWAGVGGRGRLGAVSRFLPHAGNLPPRARGASRTREKSSWSSEPGLEPLRKTASAVRDAFCAAAASLGCASAPPRAPRPRTREHALDAPPTPHAGPSPSLGRAPAARRRRRPRRIPG